jgi:hypothetical protein
MNRTEILLIQMKRTAPRTLGSLSLIVALFHTLAGSLDSALGAVVFVPLLEEFQWLHVLENEEEIISPKLDVDGDGIGDLMFASGMGGVVLYTGRNVRLVTVGGVTSNAPEGTILNTSSLIQGVGTWLYGNDFEKFNPPELGLLPLKRQLAISGFGSLPFTQFGQGGGYIGVETTGPDGIHYGWLRIENDNPQWLTGGRVTGYAYESSPGVPITVGAIPEPSCLWLASAGIGLGLRRRRK